MKTKDIVVKNNAIVLGIFDTSTYSKIKEIHHLMSYYYFTMLWGIENDPALINVERALENCEQVIFILDDIKFPINVEESITCGELQMVCQNDEYFKKTIFVKGDNVIDFDKNLVI